MALPCPSLSCEHLCSRTGSGVRADAFALSISILWAPVFKDRFRNEG